MKKTLNKEVISKKVSAEYGGLIGGIAELLEASRRSAARTVNALMTATYWEIGRRIVEFEQEGAARAGYGEHNQGKSRHCLHNPMLGFERHRCSNLLDRNPNR